MALHYTGKPPSMRQYGRDDDGKQRLPQSEHGPGYDGLPGHGRVLHSTALTVAKGSGMNISGDTMRRLNNMFTNIVADALPAAARKGKAAKDYTNDPMFKALKDQPVAENSWFSDNKEYSEDAGRKLQSKVNVLAKAGAGAFKTSYRGGKVYICKVADEYQKQRGE